MEVHPQRTEVATVAVTVEATAILRGRAASPPGGNFVGVLGRPFMVFPTCTGKGSRVQDLGQRHHVAYLSPPSARVSGLVFPTEPISTTSSYGVRFYSRSFLVLRMAGFGCIRIGIIRASIVHSPSLELTSGCCMEQHIIDSDDFFDLLPSSGTAFGRDIGPLPQTPSLGLAQVLSGNIELMFSRPARFYLFKVFQRCFRTLLPHRFLCFDLLCHHLVVAYLHRLCMFTPKTGPCRRDHPHACHRSPMFLWPESVIGH